MSVDQDCSPEIAAMIGSSIALIISDIPFVDTMSSVSIGYCDGQLVVNPNAEQRENSRLNLTVSSTKDKVMMIEAGADEIPDDLMLEAIKLAHKVNGEVIDFITNLFRTIQSMSYLKMFINLFPNLLQMRQWKQLFTRNLNRTETQP